MKITNFLNENVLKVEICLSTGTELGERDSGHVWMWTRLQPNCDDNSIHAQPDFPCTHYDAKAWKSKTIQWPRYMYLA